MCRNFYKNWNPEQIDLLNCSLQSRALDATYQVLYKYMTTLERLEEEFKIGYFSRKTPNFSELRSFNRRVQDTNQFTKRQKHFCFAATVMQETTDPPDTADTVSNVAPNCEEHMVSVHPGAPSTTENAPALLRTTTATIATPSPESQTTYNTSPPNVQHLRSDNLYRARQRPPTPYNDNTSRHVDSNSPQYINLHHVPIKVEDTTEEEQKPAASCSST